MFVDVLHRLVGVLVLVFLLARLSDWISLHLQGIAYLVSRNQTVATFFMFLVLAPGIFVHELSHWLVARLVGAKTRGFRVWPQRRGKKIQLGAVQVQSAGRLSLALIGVAPFIVGTVALIILGGWIGGTAAGMADWRHWISGTGWGQIAAFFRQADWPLRFYAVWVIANAMMPSAADREPVRPIAIGLAVLAGVAYLVGAVPAIPSEVYAAFISLLDVLAAAFLLAVVGNLAVAAVLAGVERLIGALLGVSVEY